MIQQKRDMIGTCAKCGASFQQSGIGRMRRFCGDACKQASHRKQHGSPRRRRSTRIVFDISTLHRVAGFFIAQGRYDGAAAIEHLARQVFVDLDATAIENYAKQYQANLPDLFRPQRSAARNVTVDGSASVTK